MLTLQGSPKKTFGFRKSQREGRELGDSAIPGGQSRHMSAERTNLPSPVISLGVTLPDAAVLARLRG